MKISELQSVLARLSQAAGDVEVAFKGALSDAETAITDLEIHLDPTDAAVPGTAAIHLGDAPAAEEPEPEAGSADTAAAGSPSDGAANPAV